MVRPRKAAAFVLAALIFLPSAVFAMASGDYFVRDVIDGDTIVLDNGETVRYVGVDTPEINEPLYFEAKVRNATLVQGMVVKVSVCGADKRDKFGRVLAWVTSGGVPVNETLIREGLARTLVIPPCGLVKAGRYKELEREARDKKLGIWGPLARTATLSISPYEAHMYIGRMVRVKGRVESLDFHGRSWFLDFRTPNGFRAVILPRATDEFDMRGLDIVSFKGKEVEITGMIVERNGRPEILIDSPSRIE